MKGIAVNLHLLPPLKLLVRSEPILSTSGAAHNQAGGRKDRLDMGSVLRRELLSHFSSIRTANDLVVRSISTRTRWTDSCR